MSYNKDDSEQIKFDHFQNLVTLPELLNNYETSGWFSKSAIKSMMFSSGYTQIKNTDINLVKIFDPYIVDSKENSDLVEGYLKHNNTYREHGKYYIENIADEKWDDVEFAEDDVKNVANYTYFNGGCAEGIEITDKAADLKNSIISTFVRYNIKLKDLDVGIKNLVRTANHMYPSVRLIIIPPDQNEKDRFKSLRKAIQEEGKNLGQYAYSIDVQNKMDTALLPTRNKIEKAFDDLLEALNKYKDYFINALDMPESMNMYNQDSIVKSTSDAIKKFHKEYITWDTVFKDEDITNGAKLTNNKELGIGDLEAEYISMKGNQTDWLGFSNRDSHVKKIKNSYNSILQNVQILKSDIMAEYKTGIGFTVKENGTLARLNFTTDDYKSKSVYYSTKNSKHCCQDYTKANGTYFDGTICERSYVINYKTMKELGLKNFKFTGIRIYFAGDFANESNAKYAENAPSFEIYATNSLTSDIVKKNQLGEIALMFRYGSGNDSKLYRYMINLHGYETVIKGEYNSAATYFVPFIANLKEQDENKYLYEGWYGKIEGNEYKPGVSKKAAIARAYIQFGNFKGDKFDINNQSTGYILNEVEDQFYKIDIEETKKYQSDKKQKIKTKEFIPSYFEGKLLTAEDLQNVVIGCFTNQKPNYDAKPSNWAYSFNGNAIPIILNNNDSKYSYTARISDALDITSCVFEGIDFGSLYRKNSTLYMKRFRSDKANIIYSNKGDATGYIALEDVIIQPGDVLFTASFEGEVDKYWTNSNNYITRINDQTIVTGSTGEPGGPANLNIATDALAERVMRNECFVDPNGNLARYRSTTTEKCALYVDSVGVFTHGYGISYPAGNLYGTETYNQMKKFASDYSGIFTQNTIGQIRIINKEKPTWSDIKNQFKVLIKEKDQAIGTHFTVKGYEISQDDAKLCTKRVLSTDYLNRAIEYDLKPMYRALYGLADDAKISKSDIQNSVIAGLDQTAFEILVDLRYNGSVGGRLFTKYVVEDIKSTVSGKKYITENDRKKIFADIIKKQAKLAVNRTNEFNDRHKQFAEDVWYVRDIKGKYSSSDTLHSKEKLKIELDCIANTSGYLESVFGSAFDKFLKKED